MMQAKCSCLFIFLLIPLLALSQADSRYMFKKSTSALLSYKPVKKTVKEMTKKIQEETIGDNTEILVLLAPFVTSEVKFKLPLDTVLYFNHRSQTAGVRYNYEF